MQPMAPDKPEYRVYRARRGILSRFLNRREGARFDTLRRDGEGEPQPESSGVGTAYGQPSEAGPYLPRRDYRSGDDRPPRGPRAPGERKPISWKRVLAYVAAAIAGWTLLSFVLFMISAHQQSQKVSQKTLDALDDSGNLLTSANNILLLGSDKRPGDTFSRADTIMLMRYGGGKASRLSIPRDTLVNIPGHGPNKINAAYAFGGTPLTIETIKQYLGIDINHVVEVDFKGFPKFVDALGGVDMTFGHCIVSHFEGRTARFAKGKHHLNGQQALDIVRIRKNACAKYESDLTRARRQQQFLEAVKGRVFSPWAFPRWPWAAWRAPKAVISDMGGLQLMALYLDIETGGDIKPRILRPINPGANPLVVSPAEKQAEVQRFLDG
jgi:LCP family protein required for cell wall assembly